LGFQYGASCLTLPHGATQRFARWPALTWQQLKPEMNEFSHCAAAWDSQNDGDRMVFKCSIYIKMSAEGERRAMQYREEKRAEKRINAPCRLVQP